MPTLCSKTEKELTRVDKQAAPSNAPRPECMRVAKIIIVFCVDVGTCMVVWVRCPRLRGHQGIQRLIHPQCVLHFDPSESA